MVIAPYDVGLFCFEPLDVISKGFLGLLAQVKQMVRVLLDRPIRSVFFSEDVSKLLEVVDRPGW